MAKWNENKTLLFLCSLEPDTKGMLNEHTLEYAKDGVCIINVARGGLISEKHLIKAMEKEKISLVAFDVFEKEPLPEDSQLHEFGQRVIFGSHNGSNTYEAVSHVSKLCLDNLAQMLYD